MIAYLQKFPAAGWLILSALFFAAGEYLSKVWANAPTGRGAALVVAAYAVGALAWLPALLHKNELAVMGTAWLLLATVATVVIGLFVFGENLSRVQWTGIGLAAIALFLLSK
jgi:multidrug transporter EmrE-like cation transporter